MGKKKHYKPRNIDSSSSSAKNHHHLLWPRAKWKKGYIKRLRENAYCRILIPQYTVHKEIHETIREIPLPRETSAKYVIERLQELEHYGGISNKDPLEKRLLVLIALFDYIEPDTTEALRRQLNVVRRYNQEPQ